MDKVTPFSFVQSITETKEDIFEGNEKQYSKFLVNRGLSFNVDCILYVHEIDRYPELPDYVHYQFLLNSIDKKRRYGKWVKKDTIPADVELVKEAFGYSTEKAMIALELLTDKQLLDLKDTIRKGGRS